MSKGSGRRRITPSDGLQYNPDSDMTNIEERGATSHQSGSREINMGLRTGAGPSREGYHGSHGERRGGKGRNNPERSWKTNGRGKQYEHNVIAREKMVDHRPISQNLSQRLRDKSMTAIAIREAIRAQHRRPYRYISDSYVWKRPEAQPILTLQGFDLFVQRERQILLRLQYGIY